MFSDNLLLNTDSYKASHAKQYPMGAEFVYSYVESRGGRWDRTVFFGLQMFIKQYLTKPITREMIDEAEVFWAAHGEPFWRDLWDYILDTHNGYLPIEIRAVPEGTIVGGKNVLATVVNTDPRCYWLTSFIETALLRAIWYPVTVATNSYECKQIIRKYLEQTSDNVETELPFKLHDFGARGTTSLESAAIGGAAHLVNFMGTDTVSGALAAMKFYGSAMPAYSVPAAEHSTITSWGRENEAKAYSNMFDVFGKPGAIVSVVSDSYDIYNAVENIWGGELREKVIASGATLVVRPDSGDPTTVPVELMRILADKFGFTINSKGFKVLHHVRVLQGDGINIGSMETLLGNVAEAGFSTENLVLGMGGGLHQAGLDRDTLKFAMKCSAIRINGVWQDVFKDPITDQGKRSKRGRLALVNEGGELVTVSLEGNEDRDVLIPVFRDGKLLVDQTFDEVRARARAA